MSKPDKTAKPPENSAIKALRKAAKALADARRAIQQGNAENKGNAIHLIALIQVDLGIVIDNLK